MKYLLVFISLGSLVLLYSCSKDYQPDFTLGFVNLEINEARSKIEARSYFTDSQDSIDLYFYYKIQEEGFLKILISIEDISLEIGSTVLNTKFNSVEPFGSCLTTIGSDGHVILDSYNVKNDESTITILSYDENSKLVRGSMYAKYYIDTSKQKYSVDNPDVYELNNVEFEVTVM